MTGTTVPGPGDTARARPALGQPAAHTSRPARPPSSDPAAVTRLAAILDRYPGWSAFYDKRHGLWRAAEDDPASVLYTETPDLAVVIAYITSHAEGPPAAPAEDRGRLPARSR